MSMKKSSLSNEASLTSSSSSHKSRNISYLWETKQTIKSTKSTKSMDKAIPVLHHIKSTDDDDHHEILSELAVNINETGKDENIQFQDYEITNLGDSDDDSEDEKYNQNNSDRDNTTNDKNKPKISLQRIVSLMQSDKTSDRINALKTLQFQIKTLYETIEDKVPILNFPPPYDMARIALTHSQYDSMVSDMAKGDHVKSWGIWQRTQVPIMDQFLENEENEENTTNPLNPNVISNASATKSLQEILDFCGSTLFRRFSDKSEMCRSYAIDCVKMLCLSNIDLGKHLGFLMPVITGKYPSAYFDDELNVFVDDAENHQFYKRGGATERQDRTTILTGSQTVSVVDTSEEIRLSLCELLSCLIRCFMHSNISTSLDAYFADIILSVQSHLKDPFPKLKVAAANLLVQILRVPRWELGAKEFATAIARAAIPNLRHRNSKVRISAIYLFEASVSVPNRDKIRGAGTEAIVDLIGFREENVS